MFIELDINTVPVNIQVFNTIQSFTDKYGTYIAWT